jgi:hypothetical protein
MATYKGIEIDDSGRSVYRRDIEKLLDQLANAPAGAALLKAIAAANKDKSKKVCIQWYTEQDAEKNGKCNALTDQLDPDGAHPKGSKYYLGQKDDPKTKEDERQRKSDRNGAGDGSNALVHFSPSDWGKTKCYHGAFGSMPDEVLFHELIHGLRDLQGEADETPTKDPDYRNEAEFLAIVITNVYVSSKYSGDAAVNNLRKNLNAEQLKPPLNSSDGFLKDADNLALLKKYAAQQSLLPFLQDIAQVPAAFNPIKPLIIKPGNSRK